MNQPAQADGPAVKPDRAMDPLDLIKRPYRLYFRAMDWRWFALSVRSRGCNLLDAANRFDRPIFVSGCQRSGTTILRSLIALSPDIAGSHQGRDEELAGAYVLCGKRPPREPGRYCFQTTYLNECYREYKTLRSDFRLVWVLRGPHPVVYSMVYNWARYPLNELFRACGVGCLEEAERREFERRGLSAITPVERACYAYVGKCRQLLELENCLSKSRLALVAYDEVLQNPQDAMVSLSQFLGVAPPNDSAYGLIDGGMTRRAPNLTTAERGTIDRICGGVFADCSALLKGDKG